MKTNRKSLLKILAAGLVCTLASIFLFFAGCANNLAPAGNEKAGAEYETPEASEYGLYTKLTLTLDCGDGKVWATVKNTFTVLPSAVRVNVELYKSESYKPDYKEMELASEKSVEDLNIFQTVTAEASAGGKTYFWQARMYYRIDNGAWREQLTKVMAINSEGKIVTTDIPTENLPETFCLKDIIKGEPIKTELQKCPFSCYVEFVDDKIKIQTLYELFSLVQFEKINSLAFGYEKLEASENSIRDRLIFEFEFESSYNVILHISDSGTILASLCKVVDGKDTEIQSYLSEQNDYIRTEISEQLENMDITLGGSETSSEKVYLKDLIKGEAVKTRYYYTYTAKDEISDESEGSIKYVYVVPRRGAYSDNKKENSGSSFNLFNNIELTRRPEDYILGATKHKVGIYFDNGSYITIYIRENGQVCCFYAEDCPCYYDDDEMAVNFHRHNLTVILHNHTLYESQENVVDMNAIDNYFEEIKKVIEEQNEDLFINIR